MMIKYRTSLKNIHSEDLPENPAELRLDTLELPFALPPAVEARFMGRLEQLKFNRTADYAAKILCEQIGAAVEVLPQQILLANSMQELRQKTLFAFGGHLRHCLYSDTMEPFYRRAANLGDCTPQAVAELSPSCMDIEAVLVVAKAKKPALLILGSPDLCTGQRIELADIKALAAALPDTVLLIDELAGEFTKNSAVTLFGAYDNLLLLRSFTNAYGLAVTGLSYLLASSAQLAEKLSPLFPHNAINGFAAIAADTAYQMYYEYEPLWAMVLEERARLLAAFKRESSYSVCASEGNYLFLRCENLAAVLARLADGQIAVRTFADSEKLSSCLRITVGKQADNERLLQCLLSDNC